MTKKILFISLAIIVVIISASFINRKTEVKPEYAQLLVGHFGLGINEITIIYENGDQEDMVKKLDIKIKGDWNAKANFSEEVKAFKYLNQKGFILVSHACDTKNGNAVYSYIFTKGN